MRTPRLLAATVVASLSLLPVGCAERSSAPPPSSGSTAAAPPMRGAGPGPRAMPRYDAATVQTLRGRVVRIERVPHGSFVGVHAILQPEGATGELSVHLGPSWYVDEQALVVAAGDTIEVTGSRVTIDGAPALLARHVVRGDQALVLRDEGGTPAWSGRRARR